jgi:putative tricarboxylic transport membrane protein
VIRSSGLWGGLFWLALGSFATWAGRDMGLGQLSDPGPGFAFFWVGILMCTLAAIVIGQVLVRPDATLASLWAGTRWRKVLVVVTLLLVYGAAFPTLGFVPSTLVLLLVLMGFIDPVGWRLAVTIAVVATFGVWIALTKWLEIQLPAGIFGGLFG